MKKLFLFPVLLVTLSSSAFAIEGIYLGSSLTALRMDADRFTDEDPDDSFTAGVNLGYRFFNDWSLELNAATDLAGHEMDIAQANFYYYFGQEKGQWRPYAVAGISYFDQEDSLPDLVEDEEETHQAQFGLGLAKLIDNRWELRGDIRLYHKVREGQDGTNDVAINLALNYYFDPGKPVAAVEHQPPRIPEPVRYGDPVTDSYQAPARNTVTVRLNVEFEFDKAIVRAIYGDELEAVASAMQEHEDILLVLEGHTDSRGTDQYNQNLSERRAAAVKARLEEDYGIPGDRISAVGYGESRPIADNATDEGRARNRRVIGEMSYTEIVEE